MDPIALFHQWYAEARNMEATTPDAMVLATVGADGAPAARVVLLKGADDRGFVFYTNTGSRKGDELVANERAALCFHWKAMGRQIRIEGAVERVSDAEADAYFATRPRGSQIGAWASPQSEILPSREALEQRFATTEARFPDGAVPRPPFWSGYRVMPARLEFWTHGDDRLHDRLVYRRDANADWVTERLYP